MRTHRTAQFIFVGILALSLIGTTFVSAKPAHAKSLTAPSNIIWYFYEKEYQLGWTNQCLPAQSDQNGWFAYCQNITSMIAYWNGVPLNLANVHEIHGAIFAEYMSINKVAGYPSTDETVSQGGGGRYNNFYNNGAIYWSPNTGAHRVFGAMYSEYASLGYDQYCMGFPIDDAQPISDREFTSEQLFTGGFMDWGPVIGIYAGCYPNYG